MIGLALTGGVFIAFALASSFLAPRRWPDYPGKNGLSVFIIVSLVLFGAMLTAVEVFGVEEPEKEKEKPKPTHASSSPMHHQQAIAAGLARVILPTLTKSA